MSKRTIFNVLAASSMLVFSMGVSAQLHVTPSGDVGIGTLSPTEALHLKVAGAQVLVDETGTAATRTLMLLKNPGRTHFKIQNTDFGSEWVFTNTGPAFFISLQGTGGPEFKIQNNGDAILAGVLTENSDINSKQNIEPVDGRNILEKLTNLEISEWSYIDAPGDRHVGPMAQDFHAAFGLGRTDKGIATLDSSGIALAAIKALIVENASLKEQNASISEQNITQSEQINSLETRLQLLESNQAGIQAMMATLIESQQAEPVLTKTAMN